MEYHIKTITNIVQTNIDEEAEGWDEKSRWARGSAQYGDRMRRVIRYCLHTWPGDLVEIGAMAGGMTSMLAEIAQDRQVIAIDPWETGTQNCAGWEYEAYLKNTKAFENIETLRMKSQDKGAFDYLKDRELCFALVDGRHTYEACQSDLQLVAHAPLIAVDDIGWNTDVERAFVEFGRTMIRSSLCKEGYLIG